jgi:carboxylate-amine ligase
LTLGIEEEYYVVDPRTRALACDRLPDLLSATAALSPARGDFVHEFQESIVESRTGLCRGLADTRSALAELRGRLIAAAAAEGRSIAAAGTLPLCDWRTAPVTPVPRYEEIALHYRDVVQRRATCGLHVHLGIPDRDLAVDVLNRVCPWLPVLLALSVSSPFYDGRDTGYSSYRALLWGAFPVAGMPPRFASYADYTAAVRTLIDTGAILDEGHVYWDARLGVGYETLELRIADQPSTLDEAMLQIGLSQALVLTCMREAEAGAPAGPVAADLYGAAVWRAARSGLDGDLIDVAAAERVPAGELLDRLLTYTSDALEETRGRDEVAALMDRVRAHGTGARRQHETLARTRRMEDVVDMLVAETALA